MRPFLWIIPAFLLSFTASSQNCEELYQLGRKVYTTSGYSPKVDTILAEALTRCSREFGTTHLKYVDVVTLQASILINRNKFDQAGELLQKLLQDIKRENGEETIEYTVALYYQGLLYRNMKDVDNAMNSFQRAKEIFVKAEGKTHPYYLFHLGNLGDYYRELGKYPESIPFYEELLELAPQVIDTTSADYASHCHYAARTYYENGQYERASFLEQKAVAITKELFGKNSVPYCFRLQSLGVYYRNTGNYPKAETILLESIRLLELLPGYKERHLDNFYNNLATLYKSTGELEKALPYLKDALEMSKKVFGDTSYQYSVRLNNLAENYRDLGQYGKAEPLLKQSLSVLEKYHSEHPTYAITLSNLGGLYQNTDRLDLALKTLEKATEATRERFGEKHPQYAIRLNITGSIYLKMGEYEKALDYYYAALELSGEILGEQSDSYINDLSSLGVIYYELGQFQKAREYMQDAVNKTERHFGNAHPLFEKRLSDLLKIDLHLGDYENLVSTIEISSRILYDRIATTFGILSENEKEAFLKTLASRFDLYKSLALSYGVSFPAITEPIFDNEIELKGLMLRSNKRAFDAFRNKTARTKLSDQYDRWLDLKYAIAYQYSQPLAKRTLNTDSLENKADEMESELVRHSSALRNAKQQVSWKDIQEQLISSDVMIEFTHFRYWNKGWTDSTMYAALVYHKGFDRPVMVPLFEEKQLDSLLVKRHWRTKDYIFNLYTDQLYHLIWGTLEPYLKDIKTVFYSPSGLLHRIAYSAMPKRNELLSDRYDLQYVSSTRNLLFLKENEKGQPPATALMYGGLNYKTDSTEIALSNSGNQRDSIIIIEDPDSLEVTRSWGELDTTLVEIERLETLFRKQQISAKILKGYEGNEESFQVLGRQHPSPDILHIATHGFFYPDPGAEKGRRISTTGRDNFRFADNPLFRSGLIFSGANRAWRYGIPIDGREDGILTAYEIARQNLSATQLAVLSACQTGLGDIRGSEGVYGLQRAFKMAGVEYLIITLWNIPDSYHTIEFMESFYNNWLNSNMTIREAFSRAQSQQRRKYKHPYYWAGFVLVD